MNSTHEIERDDVMRLLDGDLPEGEAAVVRAHLNSCGECATLARDLSELSTSLAAWTVSGPSSALGAGALAAIRAKGQEGVTTPGPPVRSVRWTAWPRLVPIAAAAAGVFIVLATWTWQTRPAFSEVESNQPALAGDASRRAIVQQSGQPASGVVSGDMSRGLGGQAPIGEQAADPMIVRTAELTLSTDNLDAIRPAIERLTSERRGRIASLEITGEPPTGRRLHATLRVPSSVLGELMISLRQLGRVGDESMRSEEVTDSYRDLTIRIANARREEQRLGELLSRRTGDLTEVLAVEQALSRVRGEVEQMEAHQRAMKDRVDFATVTLNVRENYRAAIALGPLSFGTRLRNAAVDGARTAASSFVDVLLAAVRVGPTLLLWCVVAGGPLWWIVRHRRARRRLL